MKSASSLSSKRAGAVVLSGNLFVRNPAVLELDVWNEKQAWAIDAAKRAVSLGDDRAAHKALRELVAAAAH